MLTDNSGLLLIITKQYKEECEFVRNMGPVKLILLVIMLFSYVTEWNPFLCNIQQMPICPIEGL